MDRKSWWSPVGSFAEHTCIACSVFIVIAFPAIALSALVQVASRHGASEFVTLVLTLLEYAVLIMDSLLFLWYLVFNSWKLMREVTR